MMQGSDGGDTSFSLFWEKKKEYEAGWLGVWNGLEGLKGEKNMIKMNCMKNKF